MIERKLQLQAAKTKGVEVTDQEVTQAVEELKKQGDKNIVKDASSTTTVQRSCCSFAWWIVRCAAW